MNPFLILALLAGGFLIWKNDGITALGDEITVNLETDLFTRFDDLFRNSGRVNHVPWRWIKAICWTESNLGRDSSVAQGINNPLDISGSTSSDGLSWGLMQTILSTSNEVRPGTTVAMLNDPATSVEVGARILARNMQHFPGDKVSIFRAYNGGLGFSRTVAGQRDTPAYAAKVQDRLDRILNAQPGDEMEFG